MKNILILGAGRSTDSLIRYLLSFGESHGWRITLGDLSLALAQQKLASHPFAKAIRFDIHNIEQRREEISKADVVISMLPARFHGLVANSCLEYGKDMLTASYVSEDIRQLDAEARRRGVLLLMECGLDPGIDHMSAMQVIDKIRARGHELLCFETFTGGLLAPSDADNPWEYKFTWNPRNVVLAGAGGVKFIQEGTYKYIPYHRLFRRTEVIHIPGHGYFEGYANRDSLKYLDVYGLQEIKTLFRGTLRRVGYCKAWDIFVQLGATDDTYEMEAVEEMTHRDFINSFLAYNPNDSVELKLAHYLQLDMEGEEMYKLKWLGIFDRVKVGLQRGTPAQILEHILRKKWTLDASERDEIVMWHKFDYIKEGKKCRTNSYTVVTGEDAHHTAMAKTVGLPLGIAARRILEGKMNLIGVQIPIIPEIYTPILEELESSAGIVFTEIQSDL